MSTAVGVSLPRLSTVIGKALSKYAIEKRDPKLVADFYDEYYRANGGKTSFDGLITHSIAGNATMTDGYGPEVWTGTPTVTSNVTASGNSIYFRGTDTSYIYANISADIENGKTYAVSFSIANYASGNLNIQARGTSADTWGTNLVSSAEGNYSFLFTAASDNTILEFLRSAGTTAYFDVDNISVREMPVIKWAPHNLLTYSEEFDNAAWVKQLSATVTANTTASPDGLTTADTLSLSANGSSQIRFDTPSYTKASYTFKVWVKCSSGTELFRLASYNATDGATETSNLTVTTEWQEFDLSFTNTVTTGFSVYIKNASDATARDLQIWGAHLYRSDLGGMAGNPDQPPSRTSYVPTTSAAKYLPRRGHHVFNGYEWVNEGCLVESEARTNVVAYSDFSSGFGASNCTRTANAAVSPDGTQNASEVTENTATSSHYISTNTTVTASVAYTMSCYFKQGSGSRSAILRTNNIGTSTYAVLDFATETITEAGVDARNATVENVGNGWYRVSFTYTQNATTSCGIIIALSNSATPSSSAPGYTGDGTSSVYIYGAQIEQAETPSSYIPTSGASATRTAETMTIPSANLPWPTPEYISDQLLTGSWATATSYDNVTTGTGTSVSVIGGTTASRSYLSIDNVDTGDVYEVTIHLTSISSGTLTLFLRDGVSPNSGTIVLAESGLAPGGSFTGYATAISGDMLVLLVATDAGADFEATVSVREINPLALTITMDGRVTYADEGGTDATFTRWRKDGDNFIVQELSTSSGRTGKPVFIQESANVQDAVLANQDYTPDVFVPFDIASRHGSTFINGAVDGVALTADTTPVALPDLSATDLNLAYDFMGTVKSFSIWDKDLGDAGIVTATEPELEPSLLLSFETRGTSYVVTDWSE